MLPFALLRHFAFAAAGGTETGYTAPGIRARMRRGPAGNAAPRPRLAPGCGVAGDVPIADAICHCFKSRPRRVIHTVPLALVRHRTFVAAGGTEAGYNAPGIRLDAA